MIPHCCLLGSGRPPRGSSGRVSVPIWLDILSDQLPVVGLVSRYLANSLIGREPLSERHSERVTFLAEPSLREPMRYYPPFWDGYPLLGGGLLTCYSAVCHFVGAQTPTSSDLHVLGTPLAFTLSQDRTRANWSRGSRSFPLGC